MSENVTVKPEIVYYTHPRTGDRIVNVTDVCIGIRAHLVTKTGHRVRLSGTWAFAPELSFTILDEATAAKAGIPIYSGYVTIGSAWQY